MLDSTLQAWKITQQIPIHTLTSCGNTLFGAANFTFRGGNGVYFYSGGLFRIDAKSLISSRIGDNFGAPCGSDFLPGEIRSWCFSPLFPTFDADGYLYVYDNGGYLNTIQARIYRSREPLCGTRVAVQDRVPFGNTFNSNAARIVPNPATNYATLQYSLTKAHFVRVELFSLLGQRMSTVFEGKQLSGEHTLSLSLHNIPKGVYICRVWVDEMSKSLMVIVGG